MTAPREATRRRLLEALRREGPMARVELGQQLGMSPASVSDLTAALLDEGILVAEEDGDSGAGLIRGRPKVRLWFAGNLGSVIGVWTGYNRIELRLVDSAGRSSVRPARRAPVAQPRGGGPHGRDRRDGPRPSRRRGGSGRRQGHRPRVPGLRRHAGGHRRLEPRPRHPRPSPRGRACGSGSGLPVLLDNDASAMAFALAQRDPALRAGRTACLMVGDGVGLGFLDQRRTLIAAPAPAAASSATCACAAAARNAAAAGAAASRPSSPITPCTGMPSSSTIARPPAG